ncbi:signal peptidase I, partial [Chloroflexota bacterium]
YIKRVIGLPGESVEIKSGVVYIHKQDGNILPLNEPYVVYKSGENFKSGVISENEYFVLGDNRRNSNDSRSGWILPSQNIIGKAWLSIWPVNEWGLAANYPFQN